jgi:hypothetical protein
MAKRGGNMKLTKLRRIEGDVNVLREDLERYLRVDPKECVINRLTGQIIVKVCFTALNSYFSGIFPDRGSEFGVAVV